MACQLDRQFTDQPCKSRIPFDRRYTSIAQVYSRFLFLRNFNQLQMPFCSWPFRISKKELERKRPCILVSVFHVPHSCIPNQPQSCIFNTFVNFLSSDIPMKDIWSAVYRPYPNCTPFNLYKISADRGGLQSPMTNYFTYGKKHGPNGKDENRTVGMLFPPHPLNKIKNSTYNNKWILTAPRLVGHMTRNLWLIARRKLVELPLVPLSEKRARLSSVHGM